MILKNNVTPFARIIGKACRDIPQINHKKIPILKVISMTYETSLADLLFHVFIIWGMNENVVKQAANNPRIVIKSMRCTFYNHRHYFYQTYCQKYLFPIYYLFNKDNLCVLRYNFIFMYIQLCSLMSYVSNFSFINNSSRLSISALVF